MRVFIAALGYASAFIGLPFVAALCIVALSVRYRAWEAVALGFMIDMLWLPLGDLSIPYFTLGSLVAVWLLEPLRAQFLH